MADSKRGPMNRQQIKASLKSAVWNLTPDVLERIDLSAPQEQETNTKPLFAVRRRMIAAMAAACLCMIILAGGSYTYQNGKVDSVIGIDVNPSVELSVNKKNRVLEAAALNEAAAKILQDMDLKGVDLNVAVNAVIGSMVTHGYLDDLDNAILVTVSNDSISKATNLRSQVVSDIQDTLEEKQVKAVVYDQQVIEEEEVKKLAEEYGISYGKAYFLKELIDQNSSLTMEDMKELGPLTMEEIAKVITDRSYAVGGHTKVTEETKAPDSSKPATEAASEALEEKAREPETSSEEVTTETESAFAPETQTEAPSQTEPSSSQQEATASETEAPIDPSGGSIKIDYVDYEDGVVSVHFKTRVKWKNPTVSIKDQEGNTYSAKVEDTGSYECEIHVSGLQGGVEYSFVLGGISPRIGKQTTVKGVFETPVIGEGSPDPEESEEDTKESEESESQSEAVQESQEPAESTQGSQSGESQPPLDAETTAESRQTEAAEPESTKEEQTTASEETENKKQEASGEGESS